MNRNSLIRSTLVGALAAGLALTSVTAAMAAPSNTPLKRGPGTYAKQVYTQKELGPSTQMTSIISMGPFSAGSYLVSFSTRINTGGGASQTVDVQCFLVSNGANVSQSMFRYPRGLYVQSAFTSAITTSAPGRIAVKCYAGNGGNPVPGEVSVDGSQLIVQRVSILPVR
jgi:hypothetical protein